VHAYFNLLIVLSQVRSCLEFDLTLGVIPSDLVATSRSPYLYIFYSVLLAPRLIVLSPGLLFRSMKSCLVGHIHFPSDISVLRPDISDPTDLTHLN
jgi:hypothetical protein